MSAEHVLNDREREPSAAARRAWPLLLTAALLLPSLAWLSLNHTILSWDAADYAINSVTLWRTLNSTPAHWPQALATTQPDRAAGICWLAEFFVPVGRRLGSIDLGLKLSILVTQLGTLLLLWAVGKRVAPERGALVPLAGCLLAAGAPLFVAMSHTFLVEPLQTFAVAWFFYLALASHRLSRLQAFSQLLAATALAMAAKVSSPVYCLLPGLIALYNLFPRRAPTPRTWKHTALDVATLAAALALALATYRWYAANWATNLDHLRQASSGEQAEFFGHRDAFIKKMTFWGHQVEVNLGTPWVLYLVAAAVAAAALWWPIRFLRRTAAHGAVNRGDVVALAALAQLLGVVCCFALNINEEVRYLLPLLPPLAILLMWSLARLPLHALGWAFVAVFILQWAFVYDVALGWRPRPASVTHWVIPFNRDRTKERELNRLLDQLSADACTRQQRCLIGVDRDWLNVTTMRYLDAQRQLVGKPPVALWNLPWACPDLPTAWNALNDCQAIYLISLARDSQPPPDAFNQAAGPLVDAVAVNDSFVRQEFPSKLGIVLYHRRLDGPTHYALCKQFADATDVRLALANPGTSSGIDANAQLTLAPGPEGMVLLADGDDPSLLLPPFPYGPAAPLVVRVELTSPVDTELEIFYQTSQAPAFAEQRKVSQHLVRGRNVVDLKLNEPALAGRLRLDPGTASGTYILHGVEVRALPHE